MLGTRSGLIILDWQRIEVNLPAGVTQKSALNTSTLKAGQQIDSIINTSVCILYGAHRDRGNARFQNFPLFLFLLLLMLHLALCRCIYQCLLPGNCSWYVCVSSSAATQWQQYCVAKTGEPEFGSRNTRSNIVYGFL